MGATVKKKVKVERMTEKDKRYVKQRKNQLREYKSLLYERNKINKLIRDLSKEMNAWDNALLN